MNFSAEFLQFLGSLVAILGLAGLAYAMKLGDKPKLSDEACALDLANQAVDGFAAVSIAVDKNGFGAILRDAEDRFLVLKPHGNKFAGRLLNPVARASVEHGKLVIDCGERIFGTVTLEIEAARAWVNAINQLSDNGNA